MSNGNDQSTTNEGTGVFEEARGYESLVFPTNIEDESQRHFIRFTILQKTGAKWQRARSGGSSISLPEAGPLGESDSTTNRQLGGVENTGVAPVSPNLSEVGSAVGSAIGGALLGGIPAGILGSFAGNFFKKVGSPDPLLNVGNRQTAGSASGKFSPIAGGLTSAKGDIILYMPIGISETYQAKWSGGELGVFGAVGKMGGTDVSGALDNIASVTRNLRDIGADITSELGGKVAGQITGNEALKKKALKEGGQGKGLVVNPHFELFFESVSPRTFTFNFKFAPQNSSDSKAVSNIIRAFKSYSAPVDMEADGAYRYWAYPMMFGIEYWNFENLHKIKPCALQNITVNYGASGTNHTFYDGYPIQTDMTLTFQEGELLTRKDFQQGY